MSTSTGVTPPYGIRFINGGKVSTLVKNHEILTRLAPLISAFTMDGSAGIE
jgi:hypothetical protein